jgi:stress-induced morphogen
MFRLAAMFEPSEIKRLIEAGIPGSTALVVDDAGDKEHFSADVISPTFEGTNMVAQHRAVYATLGARMGTDIHALQLRTWTPARWSATGRGA